MSQPPVGMLAGMLGALPALPLPNIPCAYCLADGVPPERAETIVAGTAVCADCARQAVDRIDSGQIAAALVELVTAVAHLGESVDDIRRLGLPSNR